MMGTCLHGRKLVKSQLSQLVSIFQPFSRKLCDVNFVNVNSLQNDQNMTSVFLCHII